MGRTLVSALTTFTSSDGSQQRPSKEKSDPLRGIASRQSLLGSAISGR